MSGFHSLAAEIEKLAPTPCERYHCAELAKCADEKLCCDSFRYYVNTGIVVPPEAVIPLRLTRHNQITYGSSIVATKEKFALMSQDEA